MCPRIFKEYHTLKEALSDAIFHRYAPEFYRIDFHTLRIPDSYSMFQCKYYINKYKNDPLCVNEYNTYVENYQLYCEITENFRTKCNLGKSFPVNDIVGGVNSVIIAYDNLKVYSNKLTDELIQKIIQKCENKFAKPHRIRLAAFLVISMVWHVNSAKSLKFAPLLSKLTCAYLVA